MLYQLSYIHHPNSLKKSAFYRKVCVLWEKLLRRNLSNYPDASIPTHSPDRTIKFKGTSATFIGNPATLTGNPATLAGNPATLAGPPHTELRSDFRQNSKCNLPESDRQRALKKQP